MSVGQVFYTPWCDEHGKVIDDGTVARLAEQTFRWTAADPSLRWFRQNASGLDVTIEDISEETRRSRSRGRPRRSCSARRPARTSIASSTSASRPGTIAGVTVDISRTGYTGDLGYEIWMPAQDAVRVWDALMETRPAVRHQAGRHARARRRAHRSGAAADRGGLREQQEGDDRAAGLHAVRDGPRPARQPRQGAVHRPAGAPRRAAARATPVRSSVSRSSGPTSSGFTRSWDCRRPSRRRRRASPFPCIRSGRQVGKATSTTWSPVLKKMIALATIDRPHFADGDGPADRGHRRGGPSSGRREGRAGPVLQSAPENGHSAC